jgi:hypothetical protein
MKATFPGARPGRAVFEWILDRQFLVDRSAIPGAPSSIAVVSADPGGKSYTQHYFDSRGVVRVYRMTVASGVWTLLRDSQDFTPLDFWQRFSGRFSGDSKTITGAWETSQDGSHWEHDFDLSYTKVEPRRRSREGGV